MPVSSSTEHWIKPDALTINLNHFGDPDYLQVSVLAGAVVMAFKQDVIGYNAAHNYRTWPLEAANTYLETSSAVNVYAKLTRSEVNARALIAYDTVLRDIEGREITYAEDGSEILGEPNPDLYYVFLGQVSASVNSNGESVLRKWDIDFRSGNLDTNQYQNEESIGEWTKMFRLNKVTDMIEVLKLVTSAIFKKISIKKGEKEKVVTDIKCSDDDENEYLLDDEGSPQLNEEGNPIPNPDFVPDSDNVLPSVKYVKETTEKKFLRKDQDDRSKGKIASDKGFEAGEFIPEVAGAACYQDEDGNWHIETDHLRVRKKATFTEIEIQEAHHVGGQMLLTAASMTVDYVYETDTYYRCYFLKVDSDGREVENQWRIGDQAYCLTFNLAKQADGTTSNHYLWRKVVGSNMQGTSDEAERTFGDVTISTSEYNFVDLSKVDGEYAKDSDAPLAGDEIVQLGYQGDDDSNRQNAIVIAGAGEGSPYIYEFTGIGVEPFTLPEPETKIKPNDNMFTGVMHIQGNSTGAANLTDLNIGAVNLLLNSGFTGDYKAEDLDESYNLKSGTELFSRGMKHWSGKAAIVDDEEAVSGKSAKIGWLTQSVFLIKGENYVVSFKAKGVSVNVSVGNKVKKQELISNYEHYSLKFVSDGLSSFTISGDATICDLQLERGIVATDWNPSPYDNDKALAALQAVKYLQDAICDGDTTILGGLILSSMIQLGNYKDGKMQKVNAGMSGIYNDDDDVAFWGGGTFESAIRTIMKFKQNPSYKPTDEEWKGMSNFVVSHGGDLFLRGYIHAEGGVFRGRLEANEGYFLGRLEQGNGATLLESDGSGHLANQAIRWGTNGLMYRKATDVIVWTRPNQEKGIDFNEGSYFDLSWAFPETPEQHTPTFVLPEPPADKYRICISVKQYFGIGSGKLLGSFQLYDFEQGKVDICSTVTIYQFSSDEFWLTYYVSDGCWRVDTSNYQVSNKVATLGLGGSSSSGGSSSGGTSGGTTGGGSSSGTTTSGLSQTVLIASESGTHSLTFNNGLTTQYNFSQRVVDEDEVIKILKVTELPDNPSPNTMYVIIA